MAIGIDALEFSFCSVKALYSAGWLVKNDHHYLDIKLTMDLLVSFEIGLLLVLVQ